METGDKIVVDLSGFNATRAARGSVSPSEPENCCHKSDECMMGPKPDGAIILYLTSLDCII